MFPRIHCRTCSPSDTQHSVLSAEQSPESISMTRQLIHPNTPAQQRVRLTGSRARACVSSWVMQNFNCAVTPFLGHHDEEPKTSHFSFSLRTPYPPERRRRCWIQRQILSKRLLAAHKTVILSRSCVSLIQHMLSPSMDQKSPELNLGRQGLFFTDLI